MSKATAKQIDERCERALLHLQRLLEAGEITENVYEESLKDLAKWAAGKYAGLGMDSVTTLIERASHGRIPRR